MPKTNTKELKEKIMRRIYFISYARKVLGKRAIEIYFAIILLGGLILQVSIVDVFKNSFKANNLAFGNLFNFYSQAFANTELVVKMIFSALIFYLLFMAVDMIRNISLNKGKSQSLIFKP